MATTSHAPMPDLSPPTDRPLIFVNAMQKSELAKRKLIRKHVMLGKNKGKTRTTKSRQTLSLCPSQQSNPHQNQSAGLSIQMQYSSIPPKAGSDLSFTQFAAPIDKEVMRDVLKLSILAKKLTYPLYPCIQFHRSSKIDTIWFDLLTYDVLYLHAIIFSTQAYLTYTLSQENAAVRRRKEIHEAMTLRLLRERLAAGDGKEVIEDATIFVVLCLANNALLTQNFDSAKWHLEGLRKMVDMRGGIYAFTYNTKLMIELLRADLTLSLHTNTTPIFFQDPVLEPIPAYTSHPTQIITASLADIHPSLHTPLRILHSFSTTLNSIPKTGRLISPQTLLNTMAGVMYPFLSLSTTFPPDSLDETLRVGLLLFSRSIFLQNLGGRRGKEGNTDRLRLAYRTCLRKLMIPRTDMDENISSLTSSLPTPTPNTKPRSTISDTDITLWLLMIGATCLLNDEGWLLPHLRAHIEGCGIRDWEECKERLRGVVWVDIVFDKMGREIWEDAMGIGGRN